jgi:hypothetical protein
MQRPKKGGNVKKAPPGFYLPGEARKRLGVTESVFRTMVKRGELKKVTPPMRSEGFYRAADVNKLADQNALFYLQNIPASKHAQIEFGQATEDDIQGIFDVVVSLWGAEGVTPVEVHRALYRANPSIDYVIKFRGLVLGYINATPYKPEVLEAIMAGRKRGVDLTAHDILPYEPGRSYDVYVGIVVRQDIPRHEYYTERLIYRFFGALCDLAREGITIHHMYAISDQKRSLKIMQKLGFEPQPQHPNRFVLEMETAESVLVRKYREVIHKVGQMPRSKPISRQITHDPHLDETFQYLLDALTSSDAINDTTFVTLLLPLVDQFAESSQMTIEQQALLRSIHEVLTSLAVTEP